MFPDRTTVMTLNLWNDKRWAERESAVESCLETVRPDILCLQELRDVTQERIDSVLTTHDRVEDEFPGWTREGNVYWNNELYRAVEYGRERVGILEEHRRLFWVRLAPRNATDRTMLVGTAHFTYPGNEVERETGQSPRVEQAVKTVDALDRVARVGEPVLFAGDLNDPIHPYAILTEAGYTDCFSDLNVQVRPTFPARPTKHDLATAIEIPLDWVFANDHARSITATVPHFYHGDVAPSDHWPVLATYELNWSSGEEREA